MALIDFKVLPGIDKQDTESGAENRWVDCDNVRFRYGLPEKVGGWSSLITDTIVGVARRQFAFVDLDGNRYIAIGTDKFLLIYFEGQLYDITPLATTLSSCTIATTNNSAICSITKSNHGLSAGDIVLLDNVTLPVGTGYANSDFEDKLFQVTSITSSSVFTITQSSNATATVSTGGSLEVKPYEQVGPAEQSYGYGWGIDSWGSGNWGEAASASDVSLEPGLWSLSNFGQVLVATIANGKTFTWDAGIAARLTTRASTTTSGFSTSANSVYNFSIEAGCMYLTGGKLFSSGSIIKAQLESKTTNRYDNFCCIAVFISDCNSNLLFRNLIIYRVSIKFHRSTFVCIFSKQCSLYLPSNVCINS